MSEIAASSPHKADRKRERRTAAHRRLHLLQNWGKIEHDLYQGLTLFKAGNPVQDRCPRGSPPDADVDEQGDITLEGPEGLAGTLSSADHVPRIVDKPHGKCWFLHFGSEFPSSHVWLQESNARAGRYRLY